jgi:phage baseplate assembly protein W
MIMSKMQTLSPRLPLSLGSRFGYEMLVTVRQTTKQNLKCLILTAPGERTMEPEFGVGIRKYIFQNFGPETINNIKVNIRQQVGRYMPFVKISNATITFGDTMTENPDSNNQNKMFLKLEYVVQSAGISDVLNLSLDEY